MANNPNKASQLRRLSLRFVGEVQGVGFRWTTKRLANELDLTGWVRNEPDGSVSMELQGDESQVAAFFGRLPHSWGHFQPQYVIDEKEDIATVPGEAYFRVRF